VALRGGANSIKQPYKRLSSSKFEHVSSILLQYIPQRQLCISLQALCGVCGALPAESDGPEVVGGFEVNTSLSPAGGSEVDTLLLPAGGSEVDTSLPPAGGSEVNTSPSPALPAESDGLG
jgi:hypothetical protein